MNKFFNFLLLLTLCFGVAQTLHAQGTQDDSFVMRVTAGDGSVVELSQTDCELYGTADWAGSLDAEFCAPIVWGFDDTDSLMCNASPNNYAGKIVVIRRGVCEFGAKALNAQNAGAIAVLVLNHYLTATEDACTVLNMGAGVVGAQVTIPMLFGSRTVSELLNPLLLQGDAEACFVFLRMSSPTAASMYATPLSQVSAMQAITVVYNNRSGVQQTDVNLKAEFFDPSGASVGSVTYNMPVCEPNVDSFIVFPDFFTPPVKGKHSVLYTNDKFTEQIDSIYAYFEHTDYTFATDNFVNDPGGVGPSNEQFANANFYIQSGGLCLTGDAPGRATYATFGISNIEAAFVPGDPSANIIGIAVYRADVDGDGVGDLSSSFVDDLGAGLISYVEYEMTGNEVNDALIHVPLTDLSTGADGIDLDANSGYYISLIYDGTAAGTSVCVRFRNSPDVPYASFTGYPTTPLFLGQLFTGGWNGAMVVQRLELEGFAPIVSAAEPKLLSDAKMIISPNPANEYFNLELNLDAVNPSVAATILDGNGRIVNATKVVKDFQNGVINFDVKQLPSGVYYLWVRTAEGSTMKKVSVCH
jgi:hypothetical protein